MRRSIEIVLQEVSSGLPFALDARVLVDFMNLSQREFASVMESVFSQSGFEDGTTGYPARELRLRIQNNLLFHAEVMPTLTGEVELLMSTGTFFSLQDLFYRLSCSADFFSLVPEEGNIELWTGTDCAWLVTSGPYHPTNRYLDYTPAEVTQFLSRTLSSTFFSAVPIDAERLELAEFLFEVGVGFILLHEEGHYCNGHLQWYEDKHRIGCIEEGGGQVSAISGSERRVLEWQADRTAIRAVIDVFFRRENLARLPEYTKRSPVWLFRAIIAAVGSVILILQKRAGSGVHSEFYPSEKTRLLSATNIALQRARVNASKERLAFEWNEDCEVSGLLGAFYDLRGVPLRLGQNAGINTAVMRQTGLAHVDDEGYRVGLFDSDAEMRSFCSTVLRMLLGGSENRNVNRAISHPAFLAHSKVFGLSHDQLDAAFSRDTKELVEIVKLHDSKMMHELDRYRKAEGTPDRDW